MPGGDITASECGLTAPVGALVGAFARPGGDTAGRTARVSPRPTFLGAARREASFAADDRVLLHSPVGGLTLEPETLPLEIPC